MDAVRRFLQSITREGPSHLLEETEVGYALVRRPDGDPDEFNRMARKAIDLAGDEFVALPRIDGPTGYDQVIIVPLG